MPSQKVPTGSVPKGHLVCTVMLRLSQADILPPHASLRGLSPKFAPPPYSQILSPCLFDSASLSSLPDTPLPLLCQSLSALRNLELGFRPCLIAASGEREAEWEVSDPPGWCWE